MALDKVSLYNDALLLIGERKLSSISEAREPRYILDSIWDIGAVNYCLDLIRPKFATLTAKITSSVTDTDHGYANVFTIPATYLSMVDVYSDAALDQPISRYFIEAKKLACNYSTIYLRFNADTTVAIPSGTDFSLVTPTFSKVISAYMAREMALRLSSDDADRIDAIFKARVADCLAIEQMQEPGRRSKARNGTLTTEWLSIYNDALLILGEEKLTNGSDDSIRRSYLDTAVDSGIVASILEDIGWQFAMTSAQSDYNPSITTAFGFEYGHNYPADMHILNGIYADEYFLSPIKFYRNENDVFYSNYQTMYLEYVSTSYLTTPASWPVTFRRYVAAQMAKDAAMSFEGVNLASVEHVWKQRKRDARSLDAMQSPPRVILPGSWVRSRYSRNGDGRGRP